MIQEEQAIAVFREVSGYDAELSVGWPNEEDGGNAEYRVQVRCSLLDRHELLKGLLKVADAHDVSFTVERAQVVFS